ncbi:peptidoglycan DD-metalloendopeptidase family protein [Amaricoccus solimangrovi]|uniref:M23ase beta-sheet core domain-containing protein n=1 Tax=Amaricoccus solimangrovi TaxID=2589815 RepID=A0A501WZB7_9RHOB|nr:peptidoglycan DD-metalloendopeptidase family protein [Amaricoccus solimangrovi]TPE53764.1 hypothetical protein FJM51_01585 [Amaricoccus solimangrovi]
MRAGTLSRARRALAASALGLALAPGALGATPAEDMAEAAKRIDAAGADLAAASDPATRVGALTRAIGAYQAALDILRAGVSGANARERELSEELETRRSEIQHLIAALETMARTPPPAQGMIHPGGPVAAARAAATLSKLTPALRDEAGELAREYDALTELRRLRLDGERDLATGIAALGAARTELEDRLSDEAPPQPRETEDPAMAAILRGSDTLTTLAAKLAAQGGGKRVARDAPAPRLARPVPGEIVRRFEEPDAAGVRRPGITMRAPPLSLVSAPADGIVRYVGPFLDYGYVVVVETDDGTLVVLAGLARVQVETGAATRRGDLLGQLGGPAYEGADASRPAPGAGLALADPAGEAEAEDGPSAAELAEDIAAGGEDGDAGPDTEAVETEAAPGAGEEPATGADEMLYIEVRRGQGPVDPAGLFESENG